jgi:AcrR family transcriptional regulator
MPYLNGNGAHGRSEIGRERVLSAALDVFNRYGFDSATMRQIADQLGVTDAALYHYFPSKRAMLAAILDEAWEVRLPPGAAELPCIDSEESLLLILDTVLHGLADHEEAVRIVARQAMVSAEALEVRRARSARWRDYIVEHFSPGIGKEDRRRIMGAIGYFIAGVLFVNQQRPGGLRAAMADPRYVEQMHRMAVLAIPIRRLLEGRPG